MHGKAGPSVLPRGTASRGYGPSCDGPGHYDLDDGAVGTPGVRCQATLPNPCLKLLPVRHRAAGRQAVTCVRMRRLPQRAIELWEQAGSGDWTSGGWASAAAAEDATMARTVAPMELHVGRCQWR